MTQDAPEREQPAPPQEQPASTPSDKPLTTEEVLEALKGVVDPEIMINVVDLGLVYNVRIEGNEVNIDLGLTSPMCPAGPQMLQQAKKAVEALRPGLNVNVRLTLDPPWTPDRMSEEARNQLGFF